MADIFNDEKEQEHFRRVIESFKLYNIHATRRVGRSLRNYRQLSARHRSYLNNFEDNCQKLVECIEHNDKMINHIIDDVQNIFVNASADSQQKIDHNQDEDNIDPQAYQDVDRVYTTLKQIVRDWSSDGEKERESCYGPILAQLKNLFPDSEKYKDIKVLVPGAGLGRLAFDIAASGFRCQGNEFSLHMIITSNFILNKCTEANEYKIYPYVNSWCNNVQFNDQIREISFPDICPFDFMTETFNISMTAGDFLDVYTQKDEWDCVVTCYFIDTAHNIIEYVEKIWDILKPNGYWINLGPLMYHFSDMPSEKSIELSYEQLKQVIEKVGFKYLKEDLNTASKYLDNERSLLRYTYGSIFFVVQKPPSAS